jgi:hypothetical protein
MNFEIKLSIHNFILISIFLLSLIYKIKFKCTTNQNVTINEGQISYVFLLTVSLKIVSPVINAKECIQRNVNSWNTKNLSFNYIKDKVLLNNNL